MKPPIAQTSLAARRLFAQLRRTARRILRALDLSLALTLNLLIVKLEIRISHKATGRANRKDSGQGCDTLPGLRPSA